MPLIRSTALVESALQTGEPHRLPFVANDATAGSEDELQAVVVGGEQCDLPSIIRDSRFFRNITRRSASGESPRSSLAELQEFLNDSRSVWENSWIRFPEARLSRYAMDVVNDDLRISTNGIVRDRRDAQRFRFLQNGETWLRIPISYALKLALADFIGTQPHLPEVIRREGVRLMRHFLNDNTSPETTSFHVVHWDDERPLGERLAREAARRFLFTSLLVSWANLRFALLENGQRVLVYHAPLPSVRQQELSSCISDSFYRELFMSPCLSGWSDGEEKQRYMHLCHQVLSRSQLNAVAKLREAGIIANDLIVLPSLSNVSLANNGIHISIGSRLLDASAGIQQQEVKRLGDLAIKIYEHFLVLFVGIYTAAPYRFDFTHFHPERLLSFLPHELDFTHLRLLWREWKEKANISFCGRPLTPYGPCSLDRFVAKLFGLRGDCVPDARLLTYPVAWLATESTSALDGIAGNVQRLSSELDELGILDERMSFYMPLRLRERHRDGYSGFEARYYSLFPSYNRDMAPAAGLQQFLLALAYRLALQSELTHEHIPDDPTSESERRQPFFFSGAGLPAFYVRRNSGNCFLSQLLRNCTETRRSWRHAQYLRVSIRDYRRALLGYIEESAPDLVEAFALRSTLQDLSNRCEDDQQQASTRLLSGMLNGMVGSEMQLQAREFNRLAEDFYRETLRRENLREAFSHLRQDFQRFERSAPSAMRGCFRHGVRVQNVARLLAEVEERLLRDELSRHEITTLLNLLLLLIAEDRERTDGAV